MGEVNGLRFTVKPRLLKLRQQWFELALHGWQRPAASQPELLRLILLLQPLLEIRLSPPWR